MTGELDFKPILNHFKTIHVVGGLNMFLFFHRLGTIIPTDELHHFSEG